MTNLEALQSLHRVQTNLLAVDQGLNILALSLTRENKTMALDPTVVSVIKQVDDAANKIAARMQALIDKANSAGSLSAAEVVAGLQPEVDKLNALGADPANPVPPTVAA